VTRFPLHLGVGLRVALLAALVAAAPGARAQQPEPRVASVEFQGRVNVLESTCAEVVGLKPGSAFTAVQLEADRRALLGLGYFRSVSASQLTQAGRTQVTFRVVEWPVVRHIRVLGNTLVDLRRIREVISTQLGQVLRATQLQDDIRAIERLYRERGFVARIAERIVDEATRSGILRFEVLEVRIQDVTVEGGDERLRRRAREALQELPPRFYRPEDVTLDQRRLLRIPGIDYAVPRVSFVAAGQVRVVWVLNPPPDAAPAAAPPRD
jgi:outer membrane protein assembly factor BamA